MIGLRQPMCKSKTSAATAKSMACSSTTTARPAPPPTAATLLLLHLLQCRHQWQSPAHLCRAPRCHLQLRPLPSPEPRLLLVQLLPLRAPGPPRRRLPPHALAPAAEVSACLAVLGHCHHASIACLYNAAASPDGSLFLAYELVPGAAPLSSLLRGAAHNRAFTRLASWAACLCVAADSCDVLSYIHNRLSSSILVSGDDVRLHAKISHFAAVDLAGEFPSEDADAKTGRHRRTGSRGMRIEGTRGYMAPEIIAGGTPSRRPDVFALGVLLLELLFEEETMWYDLNRAAS